MSEFGQKELNESSKWIRGSFRKCHIRGLKLVLCIRVRYEEKYGHREQGWKGPRAVTHCCPNCFQLTLFADGSKSLPAFKSQMHILTSWGPRAVFSITQVDILSRQTVSH